MVDKYQNIGMKLYPAFVSYGSLSGCSPFKVLPRSDAKVKGLLDSLNAFSRSTGQTYTSHAEPFFKALSRVDHNLNDNWDTYQLSLKKMFPILESIVNTGPKRTIVNSKIIDIKKLSAIVVEAIGKMKSTLVTGEAQARRNISELSAEIRRNLMAVEKQRNLIMHDCEGLAEFYDYKNRLSDLQTMVSSTQVKLTDAEVKSYWTYGGIIVITAAVGIIMFVVNPPLASAAIPLTIGTVSALVAAGIGASGVDAAIRDVKNAEKKLTDFLKDPDNAKFILYASAKTWCDQVYSLIEDFNDAGAEITNFKTKFLSDVENIEASLEVISDLCTSKPGNSFNGSQIKQLKNNLDNIRNNFNFDQMLIAYEVQGNRLGCFQFNHPTLITT